MGRTITSTDLVARIARAYRGVDTCHCQGDGNLTETQLFAHLVADGILELSETPAHHPMSIEVLARAGAIPSSLEWTLRSHVRLTYLSELSAWTRDELEREPYVGKKKAREIERFLARHGILLADGDPSILEEVKALDAAGEEKAVALQAMKRGARSPEEVRQRCVDGLMELAEEMMARATSMTKFARLVLEGNDRAVACMKKHVRAGHMGAPTVAALMEPLAKLPKEAKPVADGTPSLRLVANG